MEHKRIVVVLGMHRSGTSAITRGLEVLGISLGDRLLPAESENNEKGFWEDIDITAFNVDLLAAMGHDWHTLAPIRPGELQSEAIAPLKLQAAQLLRNKLAGVDLFGVKDPRMARLMPFWQSVFEHLQLDVSYVVACRNPMNVARSLQKRNGFALEKSYLLWFEHMLQSMKHSAGARRIFVDYDLMLDQPQHQLNRIAQMLELPFSVDSQAFAEYSKEFLEGSLRHNAYAPEDLRFDSAVSAHALQLHELLTDLASDRIKDDARIVEQVENLHRDLAGRYPEYRLMHSLEGRCNELKLRLDEAETIAANLAAQANEAREALAESRASIVQLSGAAEQLGIEIQQLNGMLSGRDRDIQQLNETLSLCSGEIQQLKHALSVSRTGRAALKNLVRASASRIGLVRLQRGRVCRRVKKSGLFDEVYYLSTYPDIAQAGVDPLAHFLECGWKEGRNPSPLFCTSEYLNNYQDVRVSGVSPLLHYLKCGYREGRMVPTVAGGSTRLVPRLSLPAQALHIGKVALANPALLARFVREARNGGIRHALTLARSKAARLGSHVPVLAGHELAEEPDPYNVVPHYLNPYLQEDVSLPKFKIGIHLHLFYVDMADICVEYLRNIPVSFDLYVSIPEHAQPGDWQVYFKSQLSRLGGLTVVQVPNRGRDLAPLIIEFGAQLSCYDVVAHFHTKRSPHKASLNSWFQDLMEVLCGSRSGVGQILQLLAGDAKVVYPAGRLKEHWDSSGWSDNRDIAKALLKKYSDLDIADFQSVEFPQGSMFWGKGSALREYLTLPLKYHDFPEEPIEADATLAHALERLILVFTTAHQGRNYRLESPALSDEPLHFYEDQIDFSASIRHDSIKVLAYYLPQFHPTPENDTWHGKGFTEWHKVRAANPLFAGHYQQHIPHPDIGYYHLDSPAQLALQAEMMRQAGVHGLIFYHYWFSGKLILEKPAQQLLENPDIDMPFSFCWANENWTRRWDGNEKEILLGQVYSPEDATGFIRYLIPFFKDKRYIKVEGRPVLFVYRPSAMGHVEDYLRIWREECERNGLPAPYVIATLTRGATAPEHYGMDAAVERVLHDWTGGAVDDIRHELKPYHPLNGSVLDYSEVADHYMHKELDSDYTLFRSLVPTWDNTARYGSEAILLHRFTPTKFQEWLEHLIRYSVEKLPADRRFVVINAWNEWAEGAHLEPDTRYGYSYLNTIGRALSGFSFHDTQYLKPLLADQLILHIEFGDEAQKQLATDSEARRKFLHSLAASTMLHKCRVVLDDSELSRELSIRGVTCVSSEGIEANFKLRFEKIYLFPASCIESLLLMALRHPGFGISPSVMNDPGYLHNPKALNFDISYWARAGMELTPCRGELKGHKVACKAACFHLPSSDNVRTHNDLPLVSVIMRFHRQGSWELLSNALTSLSAQIDCRVQLHLAVQDLDEQDMDRLETELACVSWAEGCEPIIKQYRSSQSNPDLRSMMLNETLKSVRKGYTAFLDYDDILFPHAYCSLVKRLQVSGKNATFARVYATRVDAHTGMILQRDRTYDYGYSYEEFIKLNHAPLHSFMLNLDRIDLSRVHYHQDMKFMEDYYLTLQLFTREDTDWASLKNCRFIGDYIHRVGDESNTLALHDKEERQQLLKSEHYVICEERITELRCRLAR